MKLPGHRHGLGGKGLVGLDEVEVVHGKPRLRHGLLAGGHGTDPHDGRVHSGKSSCDEPSHGHNAQRLRLFLAEQDHGGGSVVDAGGVAGCDHAVGLEGGLEL